MKINSTNYKQNETNFITENGNYLLKLTKWETDGYSQNGEEKIKVSCEGKKILEDGKLEGAYSFNYNMYNGERAGFTIAMLRDALKSPKVFELNDWMNRYVIAVVEMENADNGKSYPKVKRFEYSKINDKLPPFQEIKQGVSQFESESVSKANTPPEIDINEDDLPF